MSLFVNGEGQPNERLSHYREPLCFELSGKALLITCDTGARLVLHFISEALLTWGELNKNAVALAYQCLKLKDALYFVYMPDGEIAALTLDLKQGIAVLAERSRDGASRLVPASLKQGMAVGSPCDYAGAYSCEREYQGDISPLIGHSARWYCSPTDVFRTVFESPDTIIVQPDSDSAKGYACKASYMRVRQNDYLIYMSCPEGAPFKGELIMLCDLYAVRCEGCGCPTSEAEGTVFSAFGGFVREDGKQ